MVSNLLIANRGEIACRIIRTARALGVRTVAVYSDADAGAPHVAMADQAVCIGPGPASQSYLDPARLLEAARLTGADAVHPGYGFLSENAAFAQSCIDAGLIFVGPPPSAVEAMGNKAQAKRLMIEAGVPCIPGYEGAEQGTAALEREGLAIGFPLMVKAAAGGGGRGMRLVDGPGELALSIDLARSEAASSFGSGELILERAIVRPRHVEIQVFADMHGTIVHLGERDCSVQRRHQKVLEEAPAPGIGAELRRAMGEAAVSAAAAIGYVGAGTVEFLLAEDGAFYFLEMNTRLQVEHPVTEQVTGLDLVALQIEVARGRPLGLTQDAVTLTGHAIEARLCAEDPNQDFRPASGLIERWRPVSREGVRIDAGIVEGQELSSFYDSMVAKVIGYGPTRAIALDRLRSALRDIVFVGPPSNAEFLIACCEKESFRQGRATTAFIAEEFGPQGFRSAPPTDSDWAVAAAALTFGEHRSQLDRAGSVPAPLIGWSSGRDLSRSMILTADGEEKTVIVRPIGPAHLAATVEGRTIDIRIGEEGMEIDGSRLPIGHACTGHRVAITDRGRVRRFERRLPSDGLTRAGPGAILAPMNGVVTQLAVNPGDQVAEGDKLMILEAMKMQHVISAPFSGLVEDIFVKFGDQLSADSLMIKLVKNEDEVQDAILQ
ncbi:biotin carboxylase N-terminal domain-containing protein [Sphingobium estronivorans]|uniref:ATP-binding protein n=1 Tax=Sphingobium estronivorans TaxID=1577690 RepID=UPI001238CE0C|nr:biotin carboxylase N-terminal domain-containing protein [Sphingobium estronivorans]